jgi:hypothetical protein
LKGQLHTRNIFDNDQEDARRWLVERTWRPEFAALVKKAAHRLLAGKEVEELKCGAFVLECLGSQEDLPALISALDRAVAQTKTLPREEHAYPRPRGACQELVRAARMMALREVDVPLAPKSPGEAILFVTAIGTRPKFRPDGWEGTYGRLLRDEWPYVREAALVNLPNPPPAALAPIYPCLFADPDVDVQIVACRMAEKTMLPQLREPVLKVLGSGKDDSLLNAANNAAYILAPPLDQIQVLVARLDEAGMTATCLKLLDGKILEGYSSASLPSNQMLDAAAGRACKAAWEKFLREHSQALAAGKKFSVSDPELPLKELFPRFSFLPSRKP